VFKAAQLIEMGDETGGFTSFTAIDLETTDKDPVRAEIVEVAAVRVRNGEIVDTFTSLVRPRGPISPEATQPRTVSGLPTSSTSAPFEQVWPELRDFCGNDVSSPTTATTSTFPYSAAGAGLASRVRVFPPTTRSRSRASCSPRAANWRPRPAVRNRAEQAHRALPDTARLRRCSSLSTS
jgi:hypothetical protein